MLLSKAVQLHKKHKEEQVVSVVSVVNLDGLVFFLKPQRGTENIELTKRGQERLFGMLKINHKQKEF